MLNHLSISLSSICHCRVRPCVYQPVFPQNLNQTDTDSFFFLSFFALIHIVCPHCSNALTISRGAPTARYPLGVNRFECRTCPYEYVIDKKYFEKTPMKRKEVEDVFGGSKEFENADSMASELTDRIHFLLFCFL